MPAHTTQLVTDRFSYNSKPAHLSVKANGGQVTVEAEVGADDWVTVETYDADTAVELAVANGRFRFTPSGGAEYRFEVYA